MDARQYKPGLSLCHEYRDKSGPRQESSRYDSRQQQEKNKENAVEKREMGKCSRLNACAMGQQQEAEQCTERVGSFPLWPRPFDLMVTKLDISHGSTQL